MSSTVSRLSALVPVSRLAAHVPVSRLAALAALCAVASPLAALAHATFEPREITQNSYQKMVLRVPHGCKGEPTTAVRIEVPEGFVSVKPMPKPGWTLATETGPLAKPEMLHGKPVNEGVKRIIWSGGTLPDAHYDEFVFMARVTDALPAGKPVYLPVVQTCPKGEAAWVERPVEGAGKAPEFPAPGVRVVAQAGGGHAGHTAPVSAPAIRIETPWTRATPKGAKVAGGFMRITNTGSQSDRLIGGSAEVAGIFEVHEMSMEGGMMKMRALDKGLEIKPGETVELRPGGYHVMLIDLKAPISEGARVKGKLVFEKAGTLEVEFVAAPMGGMPQKAAPAGHQHGH